jgi:hypothetical protein
VGSCAIAMEVRRGTMAENRLARSSVGFFIRPPARLVRGGPTRVAAL